MNEKDIPGTHSIGVIIPSLGEFITCLGFNDDVDEIARKLHVVMTRGHMFESQWKQVSASFTSQMFVNVCRIVARFDGNNLLLYGNGVRFLGIMITHYKSFLLTKPKPNISVDILSEAFNGDFIEVLLKIGIIAPKIYGSCFEILKILSDLDKYYSRLTVEKGLEVARYFLSMTIKHPNFACFFDFIMKIIGDHIEITDVEPESSPSLVVLSMRLLSKYIPFVEVNQMANYFLINHVSTFLTALYSPNPEFVACAIKLLKELLPLHSSHAMDLWDSGVSDVVIKILQNYYSNFRSLHTESVMSKPIYEANTTVFVSTDKVVSIVTAKNIKPETICDIYGFIIISCHGYYIRGQLLARISTSDFKSFLDLSISSEDTSCDIRILSYMAELFQLVYLRDRSPDTDLHVPNERDGSCFDRDRSSGPGPLPIYSDYDEVAEQCLILFITQVRSSLKISLCYESTGDLGLLSLQLKPNVIGDLETHITIRCVANIFSVLNLSRAICEIHQLDSIVVNICEMLSTLISLPYLSNKVDDLMSPTPQNKSKLNDHDLVMHMKTVCFAIDALKHLSGFRSICWSIPETDKDNGDSSQLLIDSADISPSVQAILVRKTHAKKSSDVLHSSLKSIHLLDSKAAASSEGLLDPECDRVGKIDEESIVSRDMLSKDSKQTIGPRNLAFLCKVSERSRRVPASCLIVRDSVCKLLQTIAMEAREVLFTSRTSSNTTAFDNPSFSEFPKRVLCGLLLNLLALAKLGGIAQVLEVSDCVILCEQLAILLSPQQSQPLRTSSRRSPAPASASPTQSPSDCNYGIVISKSITNKLTDPQLKHQANEALRSDSIVVVDNSSYLAIDDIASEGEESLLFDDAIHHIITQFFIVFASEMPSSVKIPLSVQDHYLSSILNFKRLLILPVDAYVRFNDALTTSSASKGSAFGASTGFSVLHLFQCTELLMSMAKSDRSLRRQIIKNFAFIASVLERASAFDSTLPLLHLLVVSMDWLSKIDEQAEESVVALIIKSLRSKNSALRHFACQLIGDIGLAHPGLVYRGLGRREVEDILVQLLLSERKPKHVHTILRACTVCVKDVNPKPRWIYNAWLYHWRSYQGGLAERPLLQPSLIAVIADKMVAGSKSPNVASPGVYAVMLFSQALAFATALMYNCTDGVIASSRSIAEAETEAENTLSDTGAGNSRKKSALSVKAELLSHILPLMPRALDVITHRRATLTKQAILASASSSRESQRDFGQMTATYSAAEVHWVPRSPQSPNSTLPEGSSSILSSPNSPSVDAETDDVLNRSFDSILLDMNLRGEGSDLFASRNTADDGVGDSSDLSSAFHGHNNNINSGSGSSFSDKYQTAELKTRVTDSSYYSLSSLSTFKYSNPFRKFGQNGKNQHSQLGGAGVLRSPGAITGNPRTMKALQSLAESSYANSRTNSSVGSATDKPSHTASLASTSGVVVDASTAAAESRGAIAGHATFNVYASHIKNSAIELLAEKTVDAIYAFLCLEEMYPMSTYLRNVEMFSAHHVPVIACVACVMNRFPLSTVIQKRGMDIFKCFAANQIELSSIAMHAPPAMLTAMRSCGGETEYQTSFAKIVSALAISDEFSRENIIRFGVQSALGKILLWHSIPSSASAAPPAHSKTASTASRSSHQPLSQAPSDRSPSKPSAVSDASAALSPSSAVSSTSTGSPSERSIGNRSNNSSSSNSSGGLQAPNYSSHHSAVTEVVAQTCSAIANLSRTPENADQISASLLLSVSPTSSAAASASAVATSTGFALERSLSLQLQVQREPLPLRCAVALAMESHPANKRVQVEGLKALIALGRSSRELSAMLADASAAALLKRTKKFLLDLCKADKLHPDYERDDIERLLNHTILRDDKCSLS